MSITDAHHKNWTNILNWPSSIGQKIKNFHWHKTNLGEINCWPITLLNSVNFILHAEVPMILLWGNEFNIIYNNAYVDVKKKNRIDSIDIGDALIINHTKLYSVLESKLFTVINKDVKEDVSLIFSDFCKQELTASLSKIYDLEGGVGGVLITFTNQLKITKSGIAISQSIGKLIESRKVFNYLFTDAPVQLAILKGPDLICESVNEKMLNILLRKRSDVIGHEIISYLPEFKEQGYIDLMKQVYYNGITLENNEERFFVKDKYGNDHIIYSSFIFTPIKNEIGDIIGILLMGNDITKQVEARLEAKRAEELLQMSIEAANVASWTFDFSNGQIKGSEKLYHLFGFKKDQHLTISKFAFRLHKDSLSKLKSQLKENHSQISIELKLFIPPDYPERWIKFVGKIYKDTYSQVTYYLGLIIDITDQKLNDKRKNDFIGLVSHELRTPITSISAYLQLLKLKLTNSDLSFQTEILNKSITQISKMKRLIGGFLNIARLESGIIDLNKSYFNLINLVEDVLNEFSTVLLNHKIQKKIPAEIMIYADYDKIYSVISNLILNASKYSPTGSKIEIYIEPENENILISIKDYGVGIDEIDINYLFNSHNRSVQNEIKYIKNFGIGLYLCSEIIKAHKGKIWVNSQHNKGSTFYIKVPIYKIKYH